VQKNKDLFTNAYKRCRQKISRTK